MLILNENEVRELLPMRECIDVMQSAFACVASGEYVQPPRLVAWQPDRRGAVGAMPAFLGNPDALGAKLISVFPQNRSAGKPSHQGVVALFERQTGELQALIHAGAITAIRTAAVSGLATKYLARSDAKTLALIGSGEQAHSHFEAMATVRPIERVRVWSRTKSHAQSFAKDTQRSGISIEAASTVQEAIEGATIVCTLTAATEPVLQGAWLQPGMHLNAVGSSVPPFRELDTEAVLRSRIFIDHREAALREAEDLRIPIAENAMSESHVAGDLADLVSGKAAGRSSSSEITLFKSVGMAIEDLAAARYVYDRALSEGRGTNVPL